MKRRRKHPRIGPLLVRTKFAMGGKTHQGYLTSLSEGGAFLPTDEPIPVGHVFSLRCTLPWCIGEIVTEAEVVYAVDESDPWDDGYPAGVGLAFITPSADSVDKLRLFVTRFQQWAAQIDEKMARLNPKPGQE